MELTLHILVILATVGLSSLGIMSMFAPKRMVANFAIEPLGAPGFSTIRSVMGGLFLSSVVLLVFGLTTGQTQSYMAVAIIMTVVAFGRIVSILADGFDKAVLPPLIVEVVIIAILTSAHIAPSAS